jgi:tyrosine-protein kinase Etk/Wzc
MTEEIVIIPLLWKNKRKIGLALLIGVIAGLSIAYSLGLTFTAGTKFVSAENKQSGGLSSMLSSIPLIGVPGGASSSNTLLYSELLISRTNAEYIIRECGLDTIMPFSSMSVSDRVSAVILSLDVDANRQSGIIKVDCSLKTSSYPSSNEISKISELSARICNKAVEGLDFMNREKLISTSRRTRVYIEKSLAKNKIILDSVQQEMVKFQKVNKVYSNETQASSLIQGAVETGVALSKAEAELKLAREMYQPNSPQISLLEKGVYDLQGKFRESQNGGMNGNEFMVPFNQLPEITKRYLNLLRDIKILEQVNAYLETQRMQEMIQEERDVPTIQVIDRAEVPTIKSGPARVVIILITTFLAIVLSLLGILGYEMWSRWVRLRSESMVTT